VHNFLTVYCLVSFDIDNQWPVLSSRHHHVPDSSGILLFTYSYSGIKRIYPVKDNRGPSIEVQGHSNSIDCRPAGLDMQVTHVSPLVVSQSIIGSMGGTNWGSFPFLIELW